MTDDEKYLFDLTGYLIIPEVLTSEEVESCNTAIDHHIDQLTEYPRSLAFESKTLAGSSHRKDIGGMLARERPWCEPFRDILVHPRIVPYFNVILGEGYRLDHGPSVIAMDEGTEGHRLHGGGVECSNFSQAYSFKNGCIYCGLTVVEFMLADEGPGDGGLALIPGSHKANLPCPQNLKFYERYQQYVMEAHAKAGDAVIFTEALTHGALPWKGKHQRRALLYKFSPGFQAYGKYAHEISFPDYILDMTEEQRAVIEPPHIR